MAICDLCSLEMTFATSCTVDSLHRDGEAYPLLRYGQERGWKRPPARCPDCGVQRGGFHHPGCDVQRCPDCDRQLISCGCPWDEFPVDEDDDDADEDDLDPATVAQLWSMPSVVRDNARAEVVRTPLPLGAAAAPARARHRGALRGISEWALAHGRSCDLDVAALCVEAFEEHRGPSGILLDRPTVNGVLFAAVRNSASFLGTTLPIDWRVDLWTVLHWLHDAGHLSPNSDPLDALVEPLRCAGGLGEDGLPMPDGTDVDFPCQCHVPDDPTCPPGMALHVVGVDRHSLRDFVVRGRIRARSQEPVVSDYRPLVRFARRLRRRDHPFQAHPDEFIYVGRIEADRSVPELWLYIYEPTSRRGFDDLALDGDGRAWTPTPDRRRKAGFRWTPISDGSVLHRCGVAAAAMDEARVVRELS